MRTVASLRELTWLLLMCCVSSTATASGRLHALLIGVSEYPALDQSLQLAGPANDIVLYRQLLRERGVRDSDLIVLADGVPEAALPTRSAILKSFDDITHRAARGDMVFVLAGGHGSQQPAGANSGVETDGLDEIFLPRDVGRWDGAIGAVENAITDNEIGAAIERIRAKGAFVWLVFDTCHSGTITRSLPIAGSRDRRVQPEALGITAQTLMQARSRTGRVERGGAVREAGALSETHSAGAAGGYVFMYAAQSHETTPESLLPADDTLDPKTRGLFSYTLYQVLTAHAGISYRQAIEQVMQIYLSRGLQTPSPVYEGTMLDAAVFGEARTARATQWRVDRAGNDLQLRAGQLHGITEGSILAVVPSSAAQAKDVLGYVKVASAGIGSATVVPTAYDELPPLPLERIRGSAYARPVDLKVDFRLRVGLPEAGAYCDKPQPQVAQAIERLRGNDPRAARMIWVRATAPANIYLCQKGQRLLFLDASASVDHESKSLPGIDAPAATADAVASFTDTLATQLARVSRVVNLARVAAGAGAGTTQLEVTLQWQRPCAAGVDTATCSTAPQPLTAGTRAQLRDGDQVSVELFNPSFQPVDVTVLYVDAAYGISVLYPQRAGDLPRFDPKGGHRFNFNINAAPSGFERMLVLAVPVTPQSPIVSFDSLAQESMPVLSRRGGASSGGFADLLQEAVFGTTRSSTTRGAPIRTESDGPAPAMTTYAWTVLPRD